MAHPPRRAMNHHDPNHPPSPRPAQNRSRAVAPYHDRVEGGEKLTKFLERFFATAAIGVALKSLLAIASLHSCLELLEGAVRFIEG